jgi:hypothetical protein
MTQSVYTGQEKKQIPPKEFKNILTVRAKWFEQEEAVAR